MQIPPPPHNVHRKEKKGKKRKCGSKEIRRTEFHSQFAETNDWSDQTSVKPRQMISSAEPNENLSRIKETNENNDREKSMKIFRQWLRKTPKSWMTF
jgi:hypothetical protein